MTHVPGTTFYDGLNKLLTGFLLILPFIDISCSSADVMRMTLIFIASWLIGLLLWCVTEIYSFIASKINKGQSCCRKRLINKAYKDAVEYTNRSYGVAELTPSDYDAAYYRIQIKGLLGNIPVLEGLSAFCKNLTIVILWWLILIVFVRCDGFCGVLSTLSSSGACRCCHPCCICSMWGIAVLIIGLLIVFSGRCYAEYKICRLVFEADLLTIDINKNQK